MKQLLTLLLLLQCYCFCNAQTNPARHHFNSLLIKDGMPEGTVDDFLQDKQGYMWIATQKGLVRYDGYKPKVCDFGIQDPYGRWVGKIFEDSKGQLWATLSGGLYKYDRVHDNFTQQLQWKNKYPNDANEDAEGNIWLSLGDSLIRYDPVTKRSEGFSNKAKGKYQLNAETFYQIYKDKKQRIWVCSTNGLYEYNAKAGVFIGHLTHSDSSKQITTASIQEDVQQPGIFYFDGQNSYPYGNEALCRYNSNTDSLTPFHHKAGDINSIASDTLKGLYTDSKGRLWITNNGGLSLFDPLHQKFTNYIPDPADAFKSYYMSIKEDKAGNLWCGLDKGLFYFDISTKQFQRDTAESNFNNGLADNPIFNLFIDRTGIVWLGANQLGLQWVDTRRSKFIQYSDGPSADIYFKGGAVNSITKTPDGSTWMDTENGLYHQTLGDFKLIQSLPGAGKNISVGRNNICSNGLIGVWNNDKGKTAFSCYDPATGKTIDFPYSVSDTASRYLGQYIIRSICKDHLGDIWIGTWGKGIWRYNSTTKTITKFPFILNNLTIHDTHGALDDDQVQCIFEDKEGILWVGTNNGGLNRFNRDKGTFTSYVAKLPGFACVINISEDSKGNLWASTFEGGLFVLDKNRNSIKRYSEADGLLFDEVWATEEDNKGNIWAVTPRGISMINPGTGKISNIAGINNLTQAGSSIVKTNDGSFYVSNNYGFIALNPNDFAPDKEPPVVHIESMYITRLIKNKPQDSAVFIDTITSYKLHYDENRITFNYVGLYYKDPLATQYAYKLDGYDKNWVQAGTQRTVTYTNLSPGTYTFHVKAANSDGVWSTGDENIIFSIMPPWWQTWWAYTFYILAAALAVWAFAAYRSRNLRRANQLLEEKVERRTSQLNKSIDSLKATQAQLIQSEKMASLGELTAGIAHEIQNPLNFVNNFSEVSNEMIDEMKEELATGNLELATEIADDIKQNLEKINHHGKRADSIVKGMLQHSRANTGKKEPTDINALADEYLRLAYHGLRAKDKSFNTDFKTDFDESIGKINIVPQDIGRVLLNLFNNAFYAVNERKQKLNGTFEPIVKVSSKKENGNLILKVTDNGSGIPQKVIDKIFQPFFTTKPTGEGTGLGLSLSYDIIKAHGGDIKVETKDGEGSEFIIQLPLV